ncbi:hypothetical protein DICVIV_06729 [Dictyocaulus viviparus]|uniref:Saposin B-type domain-containing protein n=1 Tax=Dictyocaulus viviparus TaxID=29172 RepID=A0A0D8XTS5_DICVI|nr:hypothetical protein DICVIV_06729 [Dictyocaulus viviparus]
MENHLDPFAQVLSNKPGPVICALCLTLYHFFQYINNAIFQIPLIKAVPEAIQMTCFLLTDIEHLSPPVCEALLTSGAMPAVLKAIADSMGSFYNMVASQTMGCPPYQTLFDNC